MPFGRIAQPSLQMDHAMSRYPVRTNEKGFPWARAAILVIFALLVAGAGLGLWGYSKYTKADALVQSGYAKLQSAKSILSGSVSDLDVASLRQAAADSASARQDFEAAWSEIKLFEFPLWWAGKNLPDPLSKAGSIPPLFNTAIHVSRYG